MVAKSIAAILCITIIATTISAQENQYNSKGMINASATLSPGLMTSRKQTNFYLHGFFDARIEKSFSLRGDAYYFIGAAGAHDLFKQYHTILFGALYHVPIKKAPNLDISIGLQPGITVSQLNQPNGESFVALPPERVGISPVITTMIGVTYYVSPYFHFFASASYLAGRHFSSFQGTIPLSEVTISAGMGVNLNVLKLKKTNKKMTSG